MLSTLRDGLGLTGTTGSLLMSSSLVMRVRMSVTSRSGHVHQNPFWVTRIEIPDAHGDLVNVLDEPRWMDSTWIPRGRGRVVLRRRFPDFVGAYVHHCHILLHEDNGMMHVIEATPFADQSNYEPSRVLDVDQHVPRPTPEESFTVSYQFYDPDERNGQLYPGFAVTPPDPPSAR